MLNRLFLRREAADPAAPPDAAASPPVPHTDAAAEPRDPPRRTPDDRALRGAATAAEAAIGARRPLIDASGAIAGFEFALADAWVGRLRRRDDAAARAASLAALACDMRVAAIERGGVAFTELPAGWMRWLTPEAGFGPGCLLALPAVEAADAFTEETCAAIVGLRAAGARVGWAGQRPHTLAADFLLLRGGGAAAVRQARERALPVLAAGIEGVDALDEALAAGADWSSVAFPPDAQPAAALSLPATARREIAAFGEAILQLAGGSAGPRFAGYAAALLSLAGERPAGPALVQAALARAHLVERLAGGAANDAPEVWELLGMASMLPALVRARLDEAIEPLTLPAEGRRALLGGDGPWQAPLALAVELERHASRTAGRLAEGWGGSAPVAAHWHAAWSLAADALAAAQSRQP